MTEHMFCQSFIVRKGCDKEFLPLALNSLTGSLEVTTVNFIRINLILKELGKVS